MEHKSCRESWHSSTFLIQSSELPLNLAAIYWFDESESAAGEIRLPVDITAEPQKAPWHPRISTSLRS